jgi:hypothetical protein
MKFARWTDFVLLPLSLQLALWHARRYAQADAPEILSKAPRDDVFARGALSSLGGIVEFHGIEFANLVDYRPNRARSRVRSCCTQGFKLPFLS